MHVPGKYYNIYNRANGDENLFRSEENFRFFLRKYQLYINSWIDTFAYRLMPNHFHIFIRVKTLDEINNSAKNNSEFAPSKILNFGRDEELSVAVSKQFYKLFSSYTQALNKQIGRTGSLFQKKFKRKEVTHLSYFQNLIIYIHSNPIFHGFTSGMRDWAFTSYQTILSIAPTSLNRTAVIEWFDSVKNFEFCHQQAVDLKQINELAFD